MEEDEGTISDGGNTEVGNPSGPTDGPHFDRDAQNIHSTIDDGVVEQGAKGPDADKDGKEDKAAADAAAKEAADKAAADAKGKEGEPKEDKGPVPYDRFKEVIDERNASKEAIAAKDAQIAKLIEQITKGQPAADQGKQPDAGKDGKLPYVDITTMSEEQILDKFQTDPKGFLANVFMQMDHEIRQGLQTEAHKMQQAATEKATQERIAKTFKDYEEKNPDFRKMWDEGPDGELQRFMRDNPGHNAISAHKELTEGKRIEAAKVEAAEKATKDAEEKAQKNFKAKQSARTVGAGPAVSPTTTDDTLKDTSKTGGFVATMAQKLAASRQVARGHG